MEITIGNRHIRSFIISPRTLDPDTYWNNIHNVIQWSERYGSTGLLLFEGNDTFISPWVAAQAAVVETERIQPLVAINPVYMHPFSVAKLVSSFAFLYNRKVYLNMITGTALNYLEAMRDEVSHDDRYERLREYTIIIRNLLKDPKPVTFNGRFYQVKDLVLPGQVPDHLMPEILVSGQSDAALKICRELDGIGLQMLQPDFDAGLNDARSIHFGIVTRETGEEAWNAAHELFPVNEEDQEILEFSMQNTDSVWKRRMKLASEAPDRSESGYWLGPFRNFKADCPYLVGDYNLISSVIARLVQGGIDVFVLDITAREEEFAHVQKAFAAARDILGADAAADPAGSR